jgi:mannosyltransferase
MPIISNSSKTKTFSWSLCLITLLGFALRLTFLGRQSLWYDEAFSLAVARAGWPTFWAALLSDGVHPPGYYALLRAGLFSFGNSEFALRFPSVLVGTLALPLIYQLGRVLGGGRWGLAAALLLALNPFALWYAQEARMYSLLLCLSIAGAYAFWKLVTRPNPRHWFWLTLVSALAFLIHYFAFLFSLVQFVYLVVSLRRTYRILRWWVAAQVAAFVFFLPWAVAIVTRRGRNFGIGWIHSPTLLDLPLTVSNLALALSDPSRLWTWSGLALVMITTAAGVVITLKASVHSNIATPDSLLPTPYSLLLIWLLVPIAFVWLISLRLPLYVDRFLIICLPPLLLLISTISLSSSPVARGTMLAVIMVSAIASVRLWIAPEFTKEDWRTAAAYVGSGQEIGDALVMRDAQTGIPFGYYYHGGLKQQFASLNQQTTSLDDLSQGHERLWLVYRRPFESTHALAGTEPFTWQDEQDPLIRDWLVARQRAMVTEIMFPGVYVILYQLTPQDGPEAED